MGKADLDASLSRLLGTAPPKIIKTREARSQGVGSGTTFYALAESAKSANSELDQQLRSTLGAFEISEVSEARPALDRKAATGDSAHTPEFAESA